MTARYIRGRAAPLLDLHSVALRLVHLRNRTHHLECSKIPTPTDSNVTAHKSSNTLRPTTDKTHVDHYAVTSWKCTATTGEMAMNRIVVYHCRTTMSTPCTPDVQGC
jgi:hypothetical protein